MNHTQQTHAQNSVSLLDAIAARFGKTPELLTVRDKHIEVVSWISKISGTSERHQQKSLSMRSENNEIMLNKAKVNKQKLTSSRVSLGFFSHKRTTNQVFVA